MLKPTPLFSISTKNTNIFLFLAHLQYPPPQPMFHQNQKQKKPLAGTRGVKK